MKTYTSTLPDGLLKKLNEAADRLNTPKNKIIEKALRIFLDQIKRNEYIKSYKKYSKDDSVMQLAEEGMQEYLQSLEGFGEEIKP